MKSLIYFRYIPILVYIWCPCNFELSRDMMVLKTKVQHTALKSAGECNFFLAYEVIVQPLELVHSHNNIFSNFTTMCICVRASSVRPKGFFLFRLKPKLAETAIFLFGRNRYWNRKEFFVSAETDTETETMISLKSAISLAQWVAQKRKNFIFRQKMEEEKRNSYLLSSKVLFSRFLHDIGVSIWGKHLD